MKIRPITFNRTALQLATTMTIAGSVPGRQTYNTDYDTYVPDYTLAHLVLQPRVTSQGSMRNENLGNVKWYANGTEMSLYGSEEQREGWLVTPTYEICLAGTDAGRLVLKANLASPLNPVTLKFTAKYVDTLLGDSVEVVQTYLLTATTETPGRARLELGAAPATMYNPLRSSDTQTISAQLYVGDRAALAAKCAYAWEVKEDGSWVAVGSNPLHFHLSVSGSTITVDRTLMGKRCSLRCRATYTPGNGLPAVTYTKQCDIVRRIPDMDYLIMGVPDRITPTTTTVYPEVSVKDVLGDIPLAKYMELQVKWYVARNNAAVALAYGDVLTCGRTMDMPASLLDPDYGAVIAADVSDTGGMLPASDADGDALTDDNGNFLII